MKKRSTDLEKDIKIFVDRINPHIKENDNEHITLRAFQYIEHRSAEAYKEYKDLTAKYSKTAVNPAIGKCIKNINGLKNTGQGKAWGTTLIKTYTKH